MSNAARRDAPPGDCVSHHGSRGLAVLLNRFEMWTATVEALMLEVRHLHTDQARRRRANEQDGRDALLSVLIAGIVADDASSVSDILSRAVQHRELRKHWCWLGPQMDGSWGTCSCDLEVAIWMAVSTISGSAPIGAHYSGEFCGIRTHKSHCPLLNVGRRRPI